MREYDRASQHFKQTSLGLSSTYLLSCFYHEDNQGLFYEQLDYLVNRGESNAIIGSLTLRSKLKYGIERQNTFASSYTPSPRVSAAGLTTTFADYTTDSRTFNSQDCETAKCRGSEMRIPIFMSPNLMGECGEARPAGEEQLLPWISTTLPVDQIPFDTVVLLTLCRIQQSTRNIVMLEGEPARKHMV